MRPFVVVGGLFVFEVSASGQDVIRQWRGSAAYDRLPRALAVGGDVDADGVPDVALSSGWVHPPDPPAHVQLLSGRTGVVLFDVPDPFAGHDFGASIAFVGDLDGDGRSEIAIGSLAFDDAGNWNGKGYVKVYAGSDALELWTMGGQHANDSFGTTIAAGDFDGDGVSDLVIGAVLADASASNVDTGIAYVYSGATRSEIRRHDGVRSYDWFGNALAVGDFDGDGGADYAVGARSAGNKAPGQVHLFDGDTGNLLYALEGSARIEWFGHAVSTIGDVNGDGCDDFIVGAPYYGTTRAKDEGRALVYSGVDGTLIRSHVGPTGYTWEGWRVAGVGDCDADGAPDYALGRRWDNAEAGAVLLFSGTTGALLAHVDGTSAGELFGFLLGGGADFDLDGYSDVVAAAPMDSTRNYQEGRVDVLTIAEHPRPLGITPSRLRYVAAPSSAVTITGRHFLVQPITAVEFDGIAAGNVAVIDDTTLTCDAPDGVPGPVEISITSALGTGRLTGAFRRTPTVIVEGDFVLSGGVLVTYEFELFDSIFAIVGVGPPTLIPIRGYDGELCIAPFLALFTVTRWPSDEFQLYGTIPNDPALVGVEVLLQGLIGPALTGPLKDAAWTECVSFVIR